MAHKVVEYPDPVLRKKAEPIDKITKDIFGLVDVMIETMLEFDGVGLAANQVGEPKRIFVLNITPHEDKPTPIVMINPSILEEEGKISEEEGCLSFPELFVKIDRADRICVQARNTFNEEIVYETTGLLARAIQHEIDHLNGILLVDHITNDEDKQKTEQWLEDKRKKVDL